MANEERWAVIRDAIHFDELLEHVITTRKPVSIGGESNSAVLISIEEWNSVQEKLRCPSSSALWKSSY